MIQLLIIQLLIIKFASFRAGSSERFALLDHSIHGLQTSQQIFLS